MRIELGLKIGGNCTAGKKDDMTDGGSWIINKKSNYLEFLMMVHLTEFELLTKVIYKEYQANS